MTPLGPQNTWFWHLTSQGFLGWIVSVWSAHVFTANSSAGPTRGASFLWPKDDMVHVWSEAMYPCWLDAFDKFNVLYIYMCVCCICKEHDIDIHRFVVYDVYILFIYIYYMDINTLWYKSNMILFIYVIFDSYLYSYMNDIYIYISVIYISWELLKPCNSG